jgi:signal peptidase
MPDGPSHRVDQARTVRHLTSLARLSLHGLRALAAGWLMIMIGLAACVILPRLGGWPVAVVISGSMRPAVDVGDMIVADPGAVAGVRAGQIVLVRRPGSGDLLTHRVARVLPDGAVVTRGDANQSDDAAPVPRQDVLGVVRLVVPRLGRLLMLAHGPSPADLAWTGLLLASGVLVTVVPSPNPRAGSGTRTVGREPRERVAAGDTADPHR